MKKIIGFFTVSILLFSFQLSHAVRFFIGYESVWKDNIAEMKHKIFSEYEEDDYMLLCLTQATRYAQDAKKLNITLKGIECAIGSEEYSIIMTRKVQ